MRYVAIILVLALAGSAWGDGSNRATSVDAYAKERIDEFKELAKKETNKAKQQRLALVKELERTPCKTAQRFLLKLLKKKSTPGDLRLHALRSLLNMVDDKVLGDITATLTKAKDATLWQAFGEGLSQTLGETAKAWMAGAGLESKKPEVLCACLEGLTRAPNPAAAERIAALFAKHVVESGDVDVAYRALGAMAKTPGEHVLPALLQAARHADWRLRLGAAGILPAREPFEGEIEAAVRGLLQDDEAHVRQTAARGAGIAKRRSVANALIGLLTDPRVRTRHDAATALQQISGQKLGYDPKAWAAWLAEQTPGSPESPTFPTYHGFSIISDRVVFLVDASSSMTWPWRKETHRIDVARSELESVLRQLTPDTLFNVIVFSEKNAQWKKEEALATPGNVKSALKWAKKALAEPDGDTFFYEALETAFAKNPHFDTIYLLTDGNPTAGRYWTQAGLLASVRAWTRYRRAAINTIGLSLLEEDRGMPNLSENPGLMTSLMKALAAATSGAFREILRVPAK